MFSIKNIWQRLFGRNNKQEKANVNKVLTFLCNNTYPFALSNNDKNVYNNHTYGLTEKGHRLFNARYNKLALKIFKHIIYNSPENGNVVKINLTNVCKIYKINEKELDTILDSFVKNRVLRYMYVTTKDELFEIEDETEKYITCCINHTIAFKGNGNKYLEVLKELQPLLDEEKERLEANSIDITKRSLYDCNLNKNIIDVISSKIIDL